MWDPHFPLFPRDVAVSQQDPGKTVQTFIDLIQRHEQSFYSFVHKVHSKGEGLFDSFMRWIEQFLTLMRDGLGAPLSLEFLLPHTGPERAARRSCGSSARVRKSEKNEFLCTTLRMSSSLRPSSLRVRRY